MCFIIIPVNISFENEVVKECKEIGETPPSLPTDSVPDNSKNRFDKQVLVHKCMLVVEMAPVVN